ncbi:MAG: hypothetical protein LBP28_03140, partial [Coriobacteriales bacterium]|nr:hypothetical protein [Coriobacteriales bacterium]
ISGEAELVEGSYGLLEPRAELPAVAPRGIGLVVVPCLAATRSGQRIGYGGGFYDRYLAVWRAGRPSSSTTLSASVALCRGEFLRDSLPTDPHDIAVDLVVLG